MLSDNAARRLGIALADNNAGFEVTAALNNPGNSISNTAIATVGNGTLTAAALVGSLITRSGPTGAFTDTTDTAAAIIAALSNFTVGQSWEVVIKNTTAFRLTLAAGTGVTLSGIGVIPANSTGRFLLTVTSATAVSLYGASTASFAAPAVEVVTALSTVGAGTVTAAGIAGGVTARGGAQSSTPFTDTTDTAANIIAALPNGSIGQSWEWTYRNATNAAATLAGGTGVTVSGATLVGAGCWARYLATYTAAGTVTLAVVAAGANYTGLPPFSYSTGTTTGTFTGAEMTGGQLTVYNSTATTPGSIATATAAAMFAASPNAFVGQQWVLRIINASSAANTMTITADASVTLSGTTTYTIAEFAYRDFLITFTSATTATMVAIGGGAAAVN